MQGITLGLQPMWLEPIPWLYVYTKIDIHNYGSIYGIVSDVPMMQLASSLVEMSMHEHLPTVTHIQQKMLVVYL